MNSTISNISFSTIILFALISICLLVPISLYIFFYRNKNKAINMTEPSEETGSKLPYLDRREGTGKSNSQSVYHDIDNRND